MTHIKKLTNLLLVTLILFGHNVGTLQSLVNAC